MSALIMSALSRAMLSPVRLLKENLRRFGSAVPEHLSHPHPLLRNQRQDVGFTAATDWL